MGKQGINELSPSFRAVKTSISGCENDSLIVENSRFSEEQIFNSGLVVVFESMKHLETKLIQQNLCHLENVQLIVVCLGCPSSFTEVIKPLN